MNCKPILVSAATTLLLSCSAGEPSTFLLSSEERANGLLEIVIQNQTEQEFGECIVVLNSNQGGFRLARSIAFPSHGHAVVPLSEFRDTLGRAPNAPIDALIQCFSPAIVETARF